MKEHIDPKHIIYDYIEITGLKGIKPVKLYEDGLIQIGPEMVKGRFEMHMDYKWRELIVSHLEERPKLGMIFKGYFDSIGKAETFYTKGNIQNRINDPNDFSLRIAYDDQPQHVLATFLHAGNEENEESYPPIHDKFVAHQEYDNNMKDNEEFGDYHGMYLQGFMAGYKEGNKQLLLKKKYRN